MRLTQAIADERSPEVPENSRAVVLFTGQSGVNKRERIHQLRDHAVEFGRNVEVFSVGQRMYEYTKAAPGRILQLPLVQLELARSYVIHQIQDFLTTNADTDVYIDTHATFRWEDGLFSGFTVSEIRMIQPSLCICFVADVDEVTHGLRVADYPWPLSLKDIMFWREEEMLLTALISDIAERPNYVVPRIFSITALHRLIYGPALQRAYLSFPISRVPSQSMWELINDFRSRLREIDNLVIFDPMDITREPILLKTVDEYLQANPGATEASITHDGQAIRLAVSEVDEIRGYVNSRTRSFDYRMIDQSDIVIAYVPEHEGIPFTAEGVTMEIGYAQFVKARPIYLIWPSATRRPSLMLRPERVFASVSEAVTHFGTMTES